MLMPAIALTGGTYTQDFNTLAASGTSSTVPTGWSFDEGSGMLADGIYAANDGSSNVGNTYSYGTGTNIDRAFGAVDSGSLLTTFRADFQNASAKTITSLQIQYTGEE